jgi:PAS domain S-box-containing protein
MSGIRITVAPAGMEDNRRVAAAPGGGMDIIYLVYGLSFLAMGLAILIRTESDSQLELSGVLWLLAGFGLVHGLREWMDLWRVVRGDSPALALARPMVLAASFVFLFEFGRRLTRLALPRHEAVLGPWLYLPVAGLLAAQVATADDRLLALDVGARLLLGLTGSLLTGAGLYLYVRHRIGVILYGHALARVQMTAAVAAAGFAAYAVFGGLIGPSAPWLPASVINQDAFLDVFRIPVQLLRAACAVVMAASVGMLLRVFHEESGQRLRLALETSEDALFRLRRLTRQNRLILDSASEGILGLDLDGNAVFVNSAAARLLGFGRDELIGRPVHPLIHHPTADGQVCPPESSPVYRVMHDRVPCRVSDDLFRRKDGSGLAVRYEAAALVDEGQVVGAVMVFQDMTDRRIDETRLRENEERFRTLVESTTDWVWETDEQHRFSWMSDSFQAVLGIDPATVIGRCRWDLASDRNEIDPALWQAHIADLHARRGFRDFRYWIATGDGRARWISINGTPRHDDHGVFQGYRGSGSDITARAETSSRLKMLSTVVEQSPISVIITAPDDTIQYVNTQTLHLTHRQAEELVGSDAWRLDGGALPASARQDMRQALAAGGTWIREVASRRPGDDGRWDRVTVSAIRDDDNQIIHHLWIREDITFQKDASARIADQAAQLQRSNAELEQFAYVASHDLRQPLRMISSYLGLIERRLAGQCDDSLREFMGYALGGARRLDRLITDLLEYSRIGRLRQPAEAVSLDEAVEDSLLDLQPAIADAEAAVTVAEGLPVIMGHRTELTRLFLNLIGNAVKYRAEHRKPVVRVGWRDGGGEWVVWVSDNGIGIGADDHQRAFAVFQRLVAPDRYEGTGIGLAVCKKIVEHHGGRIWIESEPGQGTTFLIALPKAAAGGEQHPAARETALCA